MKLKTIEIKGLFGLFNHKISLKKEERITIIHGANGVGKTTILQLVHDIFRRNFHAVAKVPFEEISLVFEDSKYLVFNKANKGNKNSGENELEARIGSKGKKETIAKRLTVPTDIEIRKRFKFPLSAIEDVIPSLDQVGRLEWFDSSTEDMLNLREVILRYGDTLPIDTDFLIDAPKNVTNLLKSVPVYFIQTQRLLSEEIGEEDFRIHPARRRPRRKSVVQKWAEEMAQRVEEKLRESGALSASLDRQFPSTLLGAKLPADANESKIREIYNDQTEFRDRLMKAGLIEEEDLLDLPGGRIAQSDLKVLWFYFRDVKQKLSVFEELLPKVELFRNILNSRFLGKSLTIDREKGFIVEGKDGKSIPLNALSSGEQHELVLAYELLFKVQSNSLILVDEPELSLHVTWQHKFLDDVTRISGLVDLDFLIATHSPSIIHDRTDLMIELR